MFRPLMHSHRRPPRRGTSFILIVVIMTSIMAAVGVAYALFAMQVGRSTDLQKQGAGGGTAAPPQAPNPYNTINQFFSALIFDVDDDSTAALTNGLRGHSLAASMYGRLIVGNQIPYAGVGPFHENSSGYTFGATSYGLTDDRAMLVNHTLMTINGAPFLLDPEWTNTRGMSGAWPASFAASQTGRSYVGKHVGYSYPDTAHFYEAQVDTATGEVRVPSFHRPWVFGSLVPGSGNANWYNAQGRLLTLRPRPAEHPQFPRVPQNADGTFTGDVQNWPGGSGVTGSGNNDSIWLNLGLPVVPMGNQMVQPLVAALIVPLNGQFNASVHGNTFGTSPASSHVSYAGYGPSEVNIGYGLGITLPAQGSPADADRKAIINFRGPLMQRNGTSTRPYGGTANVVPSSAPVAWNGATVNFPAYPFGNSLVGLPTFTGFQFGNTTVTNHPSLFNPTEWPSGAASGSDQTYPLGDNKRLGFPNAFTPSWYAQSTLVPLAPNSLGAPANPAFPFVPAPSQSAANSYRLDLSHASRGLFMNRTYELDRPKLVPNFVNAANGLTLNTTALGTNANNIWATFKPGTVAPRIYPSPQTLGTVTDFQASNQWVNAMAALGSVNLNRPLADYRNLSAAPNVPTPQPLSATNMGNQAQADADRQQLARDIFVRLATALGAGLVVNTSPTSTTPNQAGGPYSVPATIVAGSAQYQSLQYLAQLSVNIVDYIDNDDISTVFIWNPNATGTADFTTASDIDNRVVFGVERTRLVINEAYSEVTDDPTVQQPTVLNPVPNTANANVRFWLELLNPTSTATLTAPSVSPINDGSVALSAYRIEIARANRQTVPMGTPPTQLGNLSAYLTTPGNATGRFGTVAGNTVNPVIPDIVYALSASNVTVPPNNGTYTQTGIQLVGPQLTKTASNIEFNPNGGVWTTAVFSSATTNPPSAAPGTAGSNSMAYTIPIQQDSTAPPTFTTVEFKRNIVLLRRLANPYLPVASSGDSTTNPYITVDMMDYVPSFDAVAYGSGDTMMRQQFAAGNTGYDPFTSRFSVGKVQPYAGHAFATVTAGSGNYNDYGTTNPSAGFPNTMVVNQKTANPPANQPKTTFGQHNYSVAQPGGTTFTPATPPATPLLSDTIMTPFDWMVHMDRPLVNQIELFQVRDTPPYRVTDQFITPSTAATSTTGISYGSGHATWTDNYAGLARGLEYLTVKSYVTGVPHGGRVPGRISLNALQDQRILQGLLDPQSGNGFDTTNFVNPVAWSQWMASRTPVETRLLADGATTINRTTTASPTVHDSPSNAGRPGTDQPFMSFGAPAAAPAPAPPRGALPFAYGGGNVTDLWSIQRRQVGANVPTMYTSSTTVPAAVAATYPSTQPNGPNYYRAEALRKMLNNSSTVNQQYLVIMTIGYFQVVGSVPLGTVNGQTITIPQLGPEAYINIPGDARQQVAAVVDMSNMAMQPSSNTIANVQPFFTSLEQTVYPNGGNGTLSIAFDRYDGTFLYVAADGQEVQIAPAGAAGASPTAATQLVLGYGTEQQVVTVQSIGAPTTLANGQQVGTVNVTGMTRTAWGGSCVSNVRPGYPGPQPNFAYDSTNPDGTLMYGPVIPYIERLK